MEEIIVTIQNDGSVVLDCNGFQGESCNITKVSEEAVGLVSRDDKDEFYKNVLQENQFNTN